MCSSACGAAISTLGHSLDLLARPETHRHRCSGADDLVESVVRRTAARQHGVARSEDAEEGARDGVRPAEALHSHLRDQPRKKKRKKCILRIPSLNSG